MQVKLSSVLDIDSEDWEKEVLKSEDLIVVDFWHDKCGWCKRLEPIYNEVAEEYKDKLKFKKLNVLKSRENQEVAVKYGVMGTPTLLFFCGRSPDPVERAVGFQPKEKLRALIERVFEKHKDCVEKSSKI